jgi:hypothetical protein
VEAASQYARYIASGQQRERMKERPVSYRTKQTPSLDLVYGRGGNWVRAYPAPCPVQRQRTHTGGGDALSFKQPTWPYDIESVDLVDSHGRWRRPCFQTGPHGHMILRADLEGGAGLVRPALGWRGVQVVAHVASQHCRSHACRWHQGRPPSVRSPLPHAERLHEVGGIQVAAILQQATRAWRPTRYTCLPGRWVLTLR